MTALDEHRYTLDGIPRTPPATIHAAARTAARHAHGPDDLRHLLDILGIDPRTLTPRGGSSAS